MVLSRDGVQMAESSARLGRRDFVRGVGGLALSVAGLELLAACGILPSPASPKKIPRIGFLSPGSGEPSPNVEAFQQGLRELGYVDGQTIAIEYRWAEGNVERLPALAAELVDLKVDVLVAAGPGPAVQAAKPATSSIPIVFAAAGDPVGVGLVNSLARPGGNMTGTSVLATPVAGKGLDLIREVVPTLSTVAGLWSASDPGMSLAFNGLASNAQSLGFQALSLGVRDANDVDTAFQSAVQGHADALVVLVSASIARHQTQIVDLAARNRLPAIYSVRTFVAAGGLIAYGASVADAYHRAATYVDKILKGTKPADLPVEQPTKFDLVVNMRTAQTLGLTIPQSILLQATELIQ